MPVSGKELIQYLIKDKGFIKVRQKGSHVLLTKQSADKKLIVVVPNHKQLKKGTLSGVLRMAQIDKKGFPRKFQ
jgi:predicted RNA binding protein YcfA (HicA-like mRNA interferase family)